jgi:hypothetical protein
MKLYIWNKDILRDWSSGIAFAIAESEEQARQMIYQAIGYEDENDDDGGISKPADEIHDLDKPFVAFRRGGM